MHIFYLNDTLKQFPFLSHITVIIRYIYFTFCHHPQGKLLRISISSIGSDFVLQKMDLTSLAINASYSFSSVHVYILWCDIIVKQLYFYSKLFILSHCYYSGRKVSHHAQT